MRRAYSAGEGAGARQRCRTCSVLHREDAIVGKRTDGLVAELTLPIASAVRLLAGRLERDVALGDLRQVHFEPFGHGLLFFQRRLQ